jgi:hypothetical protein
MLEYKLRYNNDPERIDYLRKLDTKGKSRKTFDTLSIFKRRTRKIKNSRFRNSSVISTIILTVVTSFIKNEFSVVIPAVIIINPVKNSVHNGLSGLIEKKRGRGRPRKNKNDF